MTCRSPQLAEQQELAKVSSNEQGLQRPRRLPGKPGQVDGVASKTRSPQLSELPTLANRGCPDLDFSDRVGLVAAGNQPAKLVGKLYAAVLRAAIQPRVREHRVAQGVDLADDQSPDQCPERGDEVLADEGSKPSAARGHRA